ncbi:MAG: PH domain-containing protein [Candidatus Binataceae bacterium]
MRCPQCGFEAVAGAGFCSRCGTRLLTPRPESKREFALTRIMSSWWSCFGTFLSAVVMEVLAVLALRRADIPRTVPVALFVFGILIILSAIISRRAISWNVTSERLIERRGLLSQRRREVELADIRSVEVSQSFFQRILGIGNVVVSSAASADFMIQMVNVHDPEGVAETIRRARLKRLA